MVNHYFVLDPRQKKIDWIFIRSVINSGYSNYVFQDNDRK